jgi:hypothetical protein
MEYPVYFQPLWDWAVDLLRHPTIGPQCVFDAQRLSKFDGDSFIRFIDESWTADAFWECQVCSIKLCLAQTLTCNYNIF